MDSEAAVASVVGRDAEVETLAAALAAAIGGTVQVALVVGSAGVGKTAVLNHVVAEGERLGMRVVRASGDELEAGLAFGVVGQLEPTVVQPSDSAFAVGSRLVDTWRAATEPAALVAIVDDAQWADASSLEALGFAIRRLGGSRVLVVLASRPDGLGALPASLTRLADDARLRIKLEGLDDAAFASFLRSAGVTKSTAGQRDRLRMHTDGNPKHALALLHELGASALESDVARPLPAPHSVAELVLARIASLPADAVMLIIAAAVLGVRCRLSVAAELAGLGDDAMSALEAAERANILAAERAGSFIRFLGSTTRSAVYYDVGLDRLAVLHRGATNLVTDERERLLHQLRGAPGPDEALASQADAVADSLARAGAWTDATAWLELADRVSSTERSRQRRHLTASMYRNYGGDALAFGLDTEFDPQHDHPMRLLLGGTAATADSRFGDAEALLAAAWELVDPSTDFELASRIALRMSDAMQGQLRSAEGLEWARRAVEVLPIGHDLLGEDPLTDLVFALITSGKVAEAGELLDERVPPSFTEGATAPGLLARGVFGLFNDQLVAAMADLSDCADRYMRVGPPHKYVEAQSLLTDVNYRIGLWDFAARHGEEACQAAGEGGIPQLTSLALAMSVGVAAGRGEWDAADVALKEAYALLALRGSYQALGMTWLASARLASARGDHKGVLDALSTMAAAADMLSQADDQALVPWRVLYGIALVRLGRLDEAVPHAERLTKFAESRPTPSTSAAAARLRGVLAGGRGDHQTAAAELAAAAAAFEEIPMPFEAAQAHFDHGIELRRAGHPRAAAEQLVVARGFFDRLGATPFVQRCDEEIAACSQRRRRRARGAAPTELTSAERAVADLVAAGHSNREVADALVLSVRTVEHHLSRIYAKLGVSSRSQMALSLRTLDPKDQ